MRGCCLGKDPSPEGFAKWCKTRGIFLHPDIAFLVPTKTMGCGVFAKHPVPAKTVVVECPMSASICPYLEPSADSPSIAVLADPSYDKEFKQDPVLYVVLRLLAEVCRATAAGSKGVTPWKPWLQACPRMREHFYFARQEEERVTLGLVSTFSDKESDHNDASHVLVNPLSWTTLAQQLTDMRVAERWSAVQRFIAAHPDTWPPHIATFELYCECMAQVSSRNFHREELAGCEGPYLLPGLDVLNHSMAPNCAFEMRGGGRKHATSFVVATTRPLARGEQVYCSYGRIGAARFAVEFQFTTPAVLHDNIVRLSAESMAVMAAVLLSQGSQTDEGERTVATIKGEDGTEKSLEAFRADKALLAEMHHRVECLQRMGLLYDEGFYLVQPCGLRTSDAAMKPEEKRQLEELNEKRSQEVSESVRTLLVVSALLFCSPERSVFDDLFHRINKEWLPPCLGASFEFHVDSSLLASGAPRAETETTSSSDKASRGVASAVTVSGRFPTTAAQQQREALRRHIHRFLDAKCEAAQAQDAAMDGVFGPDACGAADANNKKVTERRKAAEGRCRLAHSTLQAEMDVVKVYQSIIDVLLSA